jgi:hypothetical protein
VAERAERESKEIEGATFTPEISKLAKALWSGEDVRNQVRITFVISPLFCTGIQGMKGTYLLPTEQKGLKVLMQ